VAATNRNLSDEVRAGRFREDLLYRLDVFSMQLPPLREHSEDMQELADTLLGQLCEKYQRTKPVLNTNDLKALRGHSFPGNVRELRNLLERSLLRAEPDSQNLTIDLAWLAGRGPSPAGTVEEPEVASVPAPSRQLTAIEQQEYEMIAKALISEKGGIRRSAAKLGLTHQALLRRLQKWPELRRVAMPMEQDRACQAPE
jgi:DNA-binding NtrC family response regulator